MFAQIILVSYFEIVRMYVAFFPLLESKCEKCFYTTFICISQSSCLEGGQDKDVVGLPYVSQQA